MAHAGDARGAACEATVEQYTTPADGALVAGRRYLAGEEAHELAPAALQDAPDEGLPR